MAVLLIDGWYDLHKSEKNFIKIESMINANYNEDILKSRINELAQKYSMFIKIDNENKIINFWHIAPNNFISILFNKEAIKPECYWGSYAAKLDFYSERNYVRNEKDKIIESLKKNYLIKARTGGYLESIKNRLIELLGKSDSREQRLCNALKRRLDNLSVSASDELWATILYYYIYFAVTNNLPSKIGFQNYSKLDKDLEEYQERVILGYGCSGVPGVTQIYNMANRKEPNIIALYEMGEIEYYGRGFKEYPDYQKAYQYYEETLYHNAEHPLALWSIAYMKFNYKQIGSPLENVSIPAFEKDFFGNYDKNTREYKVKLRNWCEDIINKVTLSYKYDCAAAANLIGRIIDADDKIFPQIYKGDYKDKDSLEFYKESADWNYVFGCNNYADKCMKKALEMEKNFEQIADESIKYYEKSANELGEPYAMNILGRFYLNGKIIRNKEIVKKDIKVAYDYFFKALNISGLKKYYWPLINICENFWLKDNAYVNYGYEEVKIEEIEKLILVAVKNVNKLDQLNGLKRIIDILKGQDRKIDLIENEYCHKEKAIRSSNNEY